jgi:hypothetical protein
MMPICIKQTVVVVFYEDLGCKSNLLKYITKHIFYNCNSQWDKS